MNRVNNCDVKDYLSAWQTQAERGRSEFNGLHNEILSLQVASSDEQIVHLEKCEKSFNVLRNIIDDLAKILVVSGDVYSEHRSAILHSNTNECEEQQKINLSSLAKLEKFISSLELSYQIAESCVNTCKYTSTPTQLQLIISRWQLVTLDSNLYEEVFETIGKDVSIFA